MNKIKFFTDLYYFNKKTKQYIIYITYIQK